jgi:hypothetical protein
VLVGLDELQLRACWRVERLLELLEQLAQALEHLGQAVGLLGGDRHVYGPAVPASGIVIVPPAQAIGSVAAP